MTVRDGQRCARVVPKNVDPLILVHEQRTPPCNSHLCDTFRFTKFDKSCPGGLSCNGLPARLCRQSRCSHQRQAATPTQTTSPSPLRSLRCAKAAAFLSPHYLYFDRLCTQPLTRSGLPALTAPRDAPRPQKMSACHYGLFYAPGYAVDYIVVLLLAPQTAGQLNVRRGKLQAC